VTTLAWSAPEPAYAFEGNILATGATLVWLASVLETTPADLIGLAIAAEPEPDPTRGVDLVPAFSGLGAPWWDDRAQAVMTGFTLGSTRADVARAGVESIALQIEDVLAAAESGTGEPLATVLVDGGPSDNDDLVQLLADLTQRTVRRPGVSALSSIGAAHLAGVSAGLFTDADVRASTTPPPSSHRGPIRPTSPHVASAGTAPSPPHVRLDLTQHTDEEV
jgi:glycerol kinase